jgi:RecA-family ATPase
MTNTETPMLDIALGLARGGLKVFPITPGQKSPPLIKGWHKQATTDEAQIREWWTCYPTNSNVGVHAAGLLIVDVDPKKGGAESLKALEKEIPLAETYTVSTPSGGEHRYFSLPQGVEIANGVDSLGPGLDIRTTGGYVVAEGSKTEKGEYTVVKATEIVEADPRLIARCRAAKPKQEHQKDAPPIATDHDLAVARAKEALADYPAATEGRGGDHRTYSAVCKARDFGVPKGRAAEALQDWNARCTPPWGADELEVKIENAYQYAQGQQGSMSPEGMFNEIPPEEQRQQEEQPEKPLKLFDLARTRIGDIFTAEPPAPKFIVQGYLPAAVGQENAIGGAGKTTRQMVEGINIILGKPLWGRYPVLCSGSVVIVTKEDSADIFKYRLHHVARAMGLTPAERKLVSKHFHLIDLSGKVGGRLVEVDPNGNLQATDLAERIYTTFRQEGVVLVGFDPWNLFSPGERFVNDAEASLMAAGADISSNLKCAVRYTGHVSKMVGRQGIIDAHSGRGGAAMGDNARFVMSYVQHDPRGEDKEWSPPAGTELAVREGRLYRVHVTKMSYAPRPLEPLWIERQGFDFIPREGAPQTKAEKQRAEGERVKLFAQQGLQTQPEPTYYSKSTLETQAESYSLSQKRARVVIDRLIAGGELVELPLPEDRRHGSRTVYLKPVWPEEPPFRPGEVPFPGGN